MTFTGAEKRRAQQALRYAVKTGRINRRPCESCGRTEYLGRVIEGHHHLGYAEEHRLDVQWLCSICHIAAHTKPWY